MTASKLPAIHRILVPTDFSAASKQALAYALSLAASVSGSVELLHVWKQPVVSGGRLVFVEGEISQPLTEWSRKHAQADMDQFVSEAGAEDLVQTRLCQGEPAEIICQVAEEDEFDLIVMGTRGRSGVPRILLGSVAERVVRMAPCPVLTVRPQESP
jgi:nucleotide-binding universal stress UspA family protein